MRAGASDETADSPPPVAIRSRVRRVPPALAAASGFCITDNFAAQRVRLATTFGPRVTMTRVDTV